MLTESAEQERRGNYAVSMVFILPWHRFHYRFCFLRRLQALYLSHAVLEHLCSSKITDCEDNGRHETHLQIVPKALRAPATIPPIPRLETKQSATEDPRLIP